MVKPALPYLDVIRAVREASRCRCRPTTCRASTRPSRPRPRTAGSTRPRIVRENLLAIRRAGADQIITYHARDALQGQVAVTDARKAAQRQAAAERRVVRAREESHAGRRELARARVRQRRRHAARDPLGGAAPSSRTSDGREYLDFVGSWGPLILGHAHAKIVAAVEAACRRGMSYGAPCQPEIELAEEVVAAYPGIEQVRFVSSGTEAVMSAVRLARGATGRDLVVKFSGCYHGHVDYLLVAAGSGLATFGQPSSQGRAERARGADARAAARRHGGRREAVRGRGRPHRRRHHRARARQQRAAAAAARVLEDAARALHEARRAA